MAWHGIAPHYLVYYITVAAHKFNEKQARCNILCIFFIFGEAFCVFIDILYILYIVGKF